MKLHYKKAFLALFLLPSSFARPTVPLDKDVVEGDGIDTTSPDLQDSPRSYLRSNLRPSKHDENAEGGVATSSGEHLLNTTDFQHSTVSVVPASGGANSTLRHAEVAVVTTAIELWPGWDTSAAYDGYRVYSRYSGNFAWDVAVLAFYTDADCAPSSKIALDPTTATIISSGSAPYSSYDPTSAFDESSTSIWGGRRNGEYFWLGYESGPSTVVKCIKIDQGNSNGDWLQDEFTIQGKQGGGGWIDLYDVEGAATASGISLLSVSATWSSIDGEVPLFEDIPDMPDADVAKVMKWIAAEVGMVKNPFCWKDTFGRGVGKIPGRVSDCPSGYTNNGLTCGRGTDDIGAPSHVADCPSGYTNMGYTCYRGPNDIYSPSRVADCPSGYSNTGLTCHKWWWPHTLSGGPSRFTCPSGYFKSAITYRCHKNCPSGYTNTGESCHRVAHSMGTSSMTCGQGYFQSQATARCHKNCPNGYTNMGETCHRPVSTFGLGSMTCKPGEVAGLGGARCFPANGNNCFNNAEEDAGLCYPKCRNGYDGVGPVCWGSCDNSQVNCGLACAKTTEECVLAVADQAISTLVLAANIASLGLATPVTEGATAGVATIKVAGKTVAGTTKAGKALVKVVTKLQTIKPDGLAKGATVFQRIKHAKTGTTISTVKTTATLGFAGYAAAQQYRGYFAEDFAIQTSDDIEAELNSQFHPDTAKYLKGIWADRMLVDLAEANNWAIASSVLGLVSIVDISGVTGVVSAYAKPVCSTVIPFPCTDANTNDC